VEALGRHSDARERLIDAAGELWHTRSYADVGVSEICDHAEVQKGSFYHFFPSKRDLALAVIDERWRVHGIGEMAPVLTGPLPPLESLALFLERGLEEQLELKASTGATVGCSFGNMVVELATVDDVLRERLARLFDEWAALIQAALDDAVAAGDLPAEIDTSQAARGLLAFIEGLGVLIKANDDPRAAADLLPLALRLVGADPARLPRTAPTT
jgi:TetR/AcrR family transcriptional regulator, transcriptional repressor for nem operon